MGIYGSDDNARLSIVWDNGHDISQFNEGHCVIICMTIRYQFDAGQVIIRKVY